MIIKFVCQIAVILLPECTFLGCFIPGQMVKIGKRLWNDRRTSAASAATVEGLNPPWLRGRGCQIR